MWDWHIRFKSNGKKGDENNISEIEGRRDVMHRII